MKNLTDYSSPDLEKALSIVIMKERVQWVESCKQINKVIVRDIETLLNLCPNHHEKCTNDEQKNLNIFDRFIYCARCQLLNIRHTGHFGPYQKLLFDPR